MLRVSICCCQLLLLTQVWHVIYGDADATMEVVATCNEDALLSCQVVHDPQVAFKGISWYKHEAKGVLRLVSELPAHMLPAAEALAAGSFIGMLPDVASDFLWPLPPMFASCLPGPGSSVG
uniref:Uncharacterized protein n=1 Tax=Sphaerodactylus townsendi TaxID=933632 RepID=A0ACB8FBZ9_9SAUR